MATDCRNCPLRRRRIFDTMTTEETRFMEEFKRGELTVEAGSTILLEGSNSPQLFTALNGLGVRYKTLADGQRQVINFVFPGDFIGLQAGVMGEMQHSVEATTNMTLCVFAREKLWSIFKSRPERAYDLTWLSALEEHFLGEALSVIGRKTGVERVAWGLLKYYRRIESLDLLNGNAAPMPFRQQDLADALGLSLVHTNKSLGRLRDRQLVRWEDSALRIWDEEALEDIAGMEVTIPAPRPLF